MEQPYQGYLTAMRRLTSLFQRVLDDMEQHADRQQIDCQRCGEFPCVCGDPEFESWVTSELNKAEAEGRD